MATKYSTLLLTVLATFMSANPPLPFPPNTQLTTSQQRPGHGLPRLPRQVIQHNTQRNRHAHGPPRLLHLPPAGDILRHLGLRRRRRGLRVPVAAAVHC